MPPKARTGNGTSSPAAADDAVFARDAAAAGLAEIRMGKLAEQQGSLARIRRLGQRMVADHTKLGNRLKSIAQREGLQTPTMLDDNDSKALTNLTGKHGAAFDQAYVQTEIAAHHAALSLFRQEEALGSDLDLKRLASDAIPVLQQHLQMFDAEEATRK
jgi:putative membrane protein